MERTVQPLAKPFAALCAMLALANCSQATEPPLARAATSPAAEAVALASEADRACLTEAIYFEATAAAASQVAVAHVILNRAEDPRFPKTVCGVVRDGCQFSYRCSGRSLALHDATKRARAERAAAAVLTGAPDPTNGALFFHSAAVKPGWFSSRPRVGEIGGNVFYR
jgi:spore germination cell wall hydrolase CwlJ-like protein